MKIVSLNTWGGRAGKEDLLSFFQNHKDETDIFCLQEIWSAPYKDFDGHNAGGVPIDHDKIMTRGMQEICDLLPGHRGYFRPHLMDDYGLLMLVRNNLEVLAEGELFVYKEKGYVPNGDIGNHARNIRNLVTEYKVQSTRTRFYTKPEKFADYIFTSAGIKVKDFKVLPHEVSDHAPLYIEIGQNNL